MYLYFYILTFNVTILFATHAFILRGKIPPALPHVQDINILFGNCFIQQQLKYSLTMDQEGPKPRSFLIF